MKDFILNLNNQQTREIETKSILSFLVSIPEKLITGQYIERTQDKSFYQGDNYIVQANNNTYLCRFIEFKFYGNGTHELLRYQFRILSVLSGQHKKENKEVEEMKEKYTEVKKIINQEKKEKERQINLEKLKNKYIEKIQSVVDRRIELELAFVKENLKRLNNKWEIEKSETNYKLVSDIISSFLFDLEEVIADIESETTLSDILAIINDKENNVEDKRIKKKEKWTYTDKPSFILYRQKIVADVKDIFIEQNKLVIDGLGFLQDYHSQDCCEEVYADWNYLKPFIEQISFPLAITQFAVHGISDMGFLLEFILAEMNPYDDDPETVRLFVPCYNEQNGYYSDELELKGKIGSEIVEIDITQCKLDKIY